MRVDTSVDTPDETLDNLVKQMEPHLTYHDRERIAAHSTAQATT